MGKNVRRFWFSLIAVLFILWYQKTEAAVYDFEGIAFYAYSDNSVPGTLPVYKFWHYSRQDYFYTISEAEKNGLLKNTGCSYRGIAFYAYPENTAQGTLPTYKFWSNSRQDYLYTISEAEKGALSSGTLYTYRGVAFYAYPDSLIPDTLPVYRFYSALRGDTYYTISETEKESILSGAYGKDISVGLWSHSRTELEASSFEIEADAQYQIRDRTGNILAKVAGNQLTKVRYAGDKKLRIFNSIPEILVDREVIFEAAGNSQINQIFNVHQPNSDYDEYRGRIKLRYSDASNKIWVINILPLEQYVWGIGEIRGTGDEDYNRAMTTAFRTYGYWKILYSTKYATEGFKVDATPGNQIYRGYSWEKSYPRVKEAAIYTQGRIAKYGSSIALSPFGSWTDGRTRSFQERWGSTAYPWCKSVADPYGKHPTMSTAELEAAGNHMVGISAHGALSLATDYSWFWEKIIKYYLTGITLSKIY